MLAGTSHICRVDLFFLTKYLERISTWALGTGQPLTSTQNSSGSDNKVKILQYCREVGGKKSIAKENQRIVYQKVHAFTMKEIHSLRTVTNLQKIRSSRKNIANEYSFAFKIHFIYVATVK